MEIDKLLRRVHEMELEIEKMKASLSRQRRPVRVVVKKSVGFVLTYWTLLSFVVAIGVALYIKSAFGVDYFESYRALATGRRISEFHNKLGNEMLRRQEWSAAEDAFTKALSANANNADASYGLVKCRIFKAPPGEKFASPESQDIMLAFLRSERPADPDLDLLQSYRYWEQGQEPEARKFAEAALAKKPDLAAAALLLSHMSMAGGDLDSGMSWCRKALEAQPDYANARSNMGFIQLLDGDYAGAVSNLERAQLTSPSLLTPLVLSDAYRLQGKFSEALAWSRSAARMAADENLKDSRYTGGEWLYNFLPLSKEDRTSWKEGIYATTTERKQALCQFALALDLALTGDLAGADKSWAKTVELAPDEECRPYFINKIKATL
ncbi:MAG TPA: tetratricopeptide repeat protein, partial [Verrucomicrobiales bacterium]|nr:tetratricopeptide repeat protein [Verrucomicrobiales bacterium]